MAWACALAGVIAFICQSGCVRRRMTIRTNPPGARVYVDDYEIGTTPISANFTYYGTRKIRLVKPGYETLVVKKLVRPPLYEAPIVGFVSENLIPITIHDDHSFVFRLTPRQPIDQSALEARARTLGERVRSLPQESE